MYKYDCSYVILNKFKDINIFSKLKCMEVNELEFTKVHIKHCKVFSGQIF